MRFLDKLSNVVSGLGGGRDKSTFNVHTFMPRGRAEYDAAYRGNWFVRKGVDIIPFDMLREWRAWQAEDEVVEKIEAAETELDLRRKFMAAMIRGRLYGGGLIFVGTNDTDLTQELVIERIPQGGVRYLHVLSRHEVTAAPIIRSPLSPFYGQPAYYEVQDVNGLRQRVHPSRVVRFLGSPVPDDLTHNDGWSDSILDAVLDSVDQATATLQYIASLVPEAKTDILSIPGLTDLVSTEDGEGRLRNRLDVAASMKSNFHTLVVDAGDGVSGDKWEQKQLSFAGLPDIAKLYLQVASGAFDIPATRFIGQSPAGMNATGESDVRNFYDNIAARQEIELTPTIRPLDRILLRHALGDEPPGIWYSWNPLYQPSDKEKADVAKVKADTLKVLSDTALMRDEVGTEAAKGFLIECGLFPGVEQAYDKLGEDLLPDDEETVDPSGADPTDPIQSRTLMAAE